MCRSQLRQKTTTTIRISQLFGQTLAVLVMGGAVLSAAAGLAAEDDASDSSRNANGPLLRAPTPADADSSAGTEIPQRKNIEPQPAGPGETELGEGTSTPPAALESGIPPAPAPARGNPPEGTPPAPALEIPAGEPVPRESVNSVLQRVQLDFDRGNWNAVIRDTSSVLAGNPGQEQARQMRGRAYAATGRFEEALADVNPVPTVTTRPETNIMSGREVLATLERGTPLEITEVRGDWLLVSRTGIRPRTPGWVHREQLAPREILTAPELAGRIPPEPMPLLEPVPEPSRGGLQLDVEVPGAATIWRGRHPSRSFFELHLDIGGRSPRHHSHHPYRSSRGRDRDDWRRYVPPQFRQFLPR
ncbi:MAG: hypothetical protein KDA79_00405 [Planctomycetaceae bacterium]|nr:hypothetical protein [Planctomycetaceae bacterium]